MEFLLDGIRAVTPQQCVMYVVGALLIYLAIKKDYEPSLLLPMGFGAILVNLPMSGVLNQMVAGVGESQGIIQWLFETTIEASEALPLLLFIGIGAMIDFGPLLSNPKMFLFGAAAQFGIFFAMIAAVLLGFDLKDAASIGIIGAADGPTSILVSQVLHSNYIGPIAVAAYSYMALVPIIQPFAIKLVTTKKERAMHMPYNPKHVSRSLRICFPHHGHDHRGLHRADVRLARGLSDVRQSAARVRLLGASFPDGAERFGEPHHAASRHHDLVFDAGRPVRQSQHAHHHGAGPCRLRL